MTAMPATLERSLRATPPVSSRRVGTASPAVRPARRDGRSTGPQTRPARPIDLPRRLRRASAQSCAVSAPTSVAASGWRLTERGIAVVLVAALMIVVAALTVVGLTALRVTGDGYLGVGQSQLR